MDICARADQKREIVGRAGADRPVQLDDFILWVTIGIILGGRTGYVLFYNPAFFIEHPAAILKLWEGGMSFHGGFLGCVAAVMLFALKNNISILSLGDITTAVAPIGILLGRLANFIKGELWGREADASVPWRMIFPDDPSHLFRHPSQLYEAALEGSCCLRSWRSWSGWAR
jgi:phosphatidylglycerol:prolipoprotein diacylglycerol transferase